MVLETSSSATDDMSKSPFVMGLGDALAEPTFGPDFLSTRIRGMVAPVTFVRILFAARVALGLSFMFRVCLSVRRRVNLPLGTEEEVRAPVEQGGLWTPAQNCETAIVQMRSRKGIFLRDRSGVARPQN